MDITQTFYDNLASQYDKLFFDWQSTTREQAAILDKIFADSGFDHRASVLDCSSGIGTQSLGLAEYGYHVTASDISDKELAEARERARQHGVEMRFEHADFRALEEAFPEQFDIVIAMDNALPHMLSAGKLAAAVASIVDRLRPGGVFVASIRDYDSLLESRPPYSPPYIHKTERGRRVAFQTWDWEGENYALTQYIIEDEQTLSVSSFSCEYRATRREELTGLLLAGGCRRVDWKFPEETGFFQPIVAAVRA
jgi:SAM-dependent methyltransferase